MTADRDVSTEPDAGAIVPRVVDFRGDGPARAEGYQSLPEVERDRPEWHVARFSQAAGLKELSREYAYFTHGLLFTHGHMLHDPVVEHIAATNGECQPFHLQLPMPVFRFFDGLDATGNVVDDSWNYTICAVPKAQWPALYAFLAQCGGANRDARYCFKVVPQRIPIVDTLALSRLATLPSPVPTVDCLSFALCTNRNTVYFAPNHRKESWGAVPVLKRLPEVKMVRYAKQLFAGANRPAAGALEPTREDALAALIKGSRRDA